MPTSRLGNTVATPEVKSPRGQSAGHSVADAGQTVPTVGGRSVTLPGREKLPCRLGLGGGELGVSFQHRGLPEGRATGAGEPHLRRVHRHIRRLVRRPHGERDLRHGLLVHLARRGDCRDADGWNTGLPSAVRVRVPPADPSHHNRTNSEQLKGCGPFFALDRDSARTRASLPSTRRSTRRGRIWPRLRCRCRWTASGRNSPAPARGRTRRTTWRGPSRRTARQSADSWGASGSPASSPVSGWPACPNPSDGT